MPATQTTRLAILLRAFLFFLAFVCLLYSVMKIPAEKRFQLCEEDIMHLQALRDAAQKRQQQFQDISAMKREIAALEENISQQLTQLMRDMGFAPGPCKLAIDEYKRRIFAAPSPDKASSEDIAAIKEAATELVKRVPHRADAHCQLAWAYIVSDEWDKAIPELETARLWFPWYAPHLLLRAVVEARSKAGLQAIEHVKAIVERGENGRPLLSIDPKDEVQRQALDALVRHLPPVFPDMDFRVNKPTITNE